MRPIAIACALCLAFAAACGKKGGDDAPAGENDWEKLIEAWDAPDPIPNVALTGSDGEVFRLHDMARGAYVLVSFVYTRCPIPEACPLTIDKMRHVQRAFRERGDTDRTLALLSVTLDPAYDTPAVLARYANERDMDTSNWVLATGPAELVTNALPALFNILAIPQGEADISHTVKIALLRPDFTLLREWGDNHVESAEVVDLVLSDDPPAR